MIPLHTLDSLQASQRAIAAPFRLLLADGSELHCTDVLRLLPGKRIVLRGNHHGSIVLAKLFFAMRNWQQELDGYALLQQTGVVTPSLLSQYALGNGGVCLYEFIGHATGLDQVWQQADNHRKTALLQQLLHVLQQCYAQQVLQADLHLGNFLLQQNPPSQDDPLPPDDTLVVLDPASCCRIDRPAAIASNLALLLAQLPFADWPLARQAICAMFPALAGETLLQQARQLWQQRQRDYLAKIQRDCSDVADLGNRTLRILCRRTALTAALASRLQHPQQLAAGATVLKNGNSATVFLLDIDGRKLVAKQYRNKDLLRTIRRAFRPSRAARAWHFAHALAFAGIRVPAPVALVEQKRGPLVSAAWYLSEYENGRDLLSCWRERAPTDSELAAIRALFLALRESRTSHGDLKATNLISDGQHIALIDYDGAREHRSDRTLQRALAEDRARFLQNWPDDPALQARLRELIDA